MDVSLTSFTPPLVISTTATSVVENRDAVTLRTLRIGHTRFSHSYLLNREDQPRCTYCDCALTVVHILLESPHYSIVRQRYFSVTTLKDLFERVNTTLFWILLVFTIVFN